MLASILDSIRFDGLHAAILVVVAILIAIQHFHNRAVRAERDAASKRCGQLMDEVKSRDHAVTEVNRLRRQAVKKQDMLEAECRARQRVQAERDSLSVELRGTLAMLNTAEAKLRDEKGTSAARIKELESECAEWQKAAQEASEESSANHMQLTALQAAAHDAARKLAASIGMECSHRRETTWVDATDAARRIELEMHKIETGKQEVTSVGTIGLVEESWEQALKEVALPYTWVDSALKPSS